MGKWCNEIPGCYVVHRREFDTTAADRFSAGMIKDTNGEEMLHNRYNYGKEDRIEKNKIGKYGEEAFRVFLRVMIKSAFVQKYQKVRFSPCFL